VLWRRAGGGQIGWVSDSISTNWIVRCPRRSELARIDQFQERARSTAGVQDETLFAEKDGEGPFPFSVDRSVMLRSWLTFVYFARSGSWGSLLSIDDVSLGIKPSSLPELSDPSLPSARA
jgi:hypothetical protein